MKNDIRNSCNGSKGCRVYVLTHDSGIKPIFSGMHETTDAVQTLLSLVASSVDEELETKRSMEKESISSSATGSLCVL